MLDPATGKWEEMIKAIVGWSESSCICEAAGGKVWFGYDRTRYQARSYLVDGVLFSYYYRHNKI